MHVSEPKIILKNPTIPGAILPVILYADQTGAILSNPGDVVVTRKPIEAPFLEYLTELCLVPNDITFVHPSDNEKVLGTYDGLFTDSILLQKLSPFISTHQTLLTLYNTSLENTFAEWLGIALYGNATASIENSSKSYLSKILDSLDVPRPKRIESVKKTDLVDVIATFFVSFPTSEIVVKHDHGSGSCGNFRVLKDSYLRLTDSEKDVWVSQKIGSLIQKSTEDSYVVEEFIDDAFASPSVFFNRMEDVYSPLFIHEQRFIGHELHYAGCSSRTISNTNQEVVTLVDIGNRLAGYFASFAPIIPCFGFDAVVSPTRGILVVDLNIRMIAGCIPFRAQKLLGVPSSYFYTASSKTLRANSHLVWSEFKEHIAGLLYPIAGKHEGVVLLNTFIYTKDNVWRRHIEFLCVGENIDKVQAYESALLSQLSQ